MLPFFGKDKSRTAGVSVYIGSASVGASIVISETGKATPQIIWSYREDIASGRDKQKNMLTALLNVLLNTASQGQRVLFKEFPRLRLDMVDVVISSPFSYTVTKQVKTNFEQPTRISKRLVSDMVEKAEIEIKKLVTETAVAKTLKLSVLSSLTTGLALNGYRTVKPSADTVAKDVELNQLVALCDTDLKKKIEEVVEKAFPASDMSFSTFMFRYFEVVRQIATHSGSVGLINVNNGATEVLMLTAGVPTASGATEIGKNDVIGDLIDKVGLPEGVALGLISDAKTTHTDTLSESRKQLMTEVLTNYEKDVSKLLENLDGVFLTPQVVYLHTNPRNQDFFAARMEKGIRTVGSNKVKVHKVDAGLLGWKGGEDMALLLPALGFHQHRG